MTGGGYVYSNVVVVVFVMAKSHCILPVASSIILSVSAVVKDDVQVIVPAVVVGVWRVDDRPVAQGSLFSFVGSFCVRRLDIGDARFAKVSGDLQSFFSADLMRQLGDDARLDPAATADLDADGGGLFVAGRPVGFEER